LNNIYPLENKKIMDEISEHGAVISEFPMRTLPMSYNFPRRNRIISGLTMGVIVVEAAQRSGALITADFALEQGREVYAVPGKIDQPFAGGVNRLIKQGAKLVTCVEDVLEDIGPVITNQEAPQRAIKSGQLEGLSAQEKHVFDLIHDRPVHIDELIGDCGRSVPVMSVLLNLELKQLVRQLPGKLFVR